MGNKIILIVVCIFIASTSQVSANPISVVDERRAWKSFDEVIKDYLSLPDNSDSEFYTHEIFQATGLGLRSAERLLDTIRITGRSGETRATALEKILISNKSMREIAVIGLMMALSETRNVPPDVVKEWARQRYKIKEVSDDVVETRDRVLAAIEVLLRTPSEPHKPTKVR